MQIIMFYTSLQGEYVYIFIFYFSTLALFSTSPLAMGFMKYKFQKFFPEMT